MKQHLDNAIAWIKDAKINDRPIEGVLTGSCLLGEYWKGMDVDIFVYSGEEFINLLWKLFYDNKFLILDPKEQWKFNKFTTETMYNSNHKIGVNTIKFMWNQVIPVNIIFKNNKKGIFDVLSSFDMDIVARGYDLKTGVMLDLSAPGSIESKIASPNKWNDRFDNVTIWSVSQLLRQADRIIKYYRRGFNTDPMVIKYIELIDRIMKEQNIFESVKYGEILKTAQVNFKTVKKVFQTWLKTHEISDKELELLNKTIKEV